MDAQYIAMAGVVDLASERVVLFERNDKELSAYIYACIEEGSGDLVIEGQDLGSAVKGVFGDSDYEYWLRVRAVNTGALLEALAAEHGVEMGDPSASEQNPGQLLLALIQQHYSNYQAEVMLRNFCKRKTIPCEFFSYS